MGKGDNRRTRKMRRRVGMKKKKLRYTRQLAEATKKTAKAKK